MGSAAYRPAGRWHVRWEVATERARASKFDLATAGDDEDVLRSLPVDYGCGEWDIVGQHTHARTDAPSRPVDERKERTGDATLDGLPPGDTKGRAVPRDGGTRAFRETD
jgi:hypothetical protein